MVNIKKNTEKFIEESKSIHGDKYDYSLAEYKGAFKKVIIICSNHGKFEQRASRHSRGAGCEKCAKENKKIGIDNFISTANKVHNNRYDYSKFIYNEAKTPSIIICKIHGEFLQAPYSHTRGKQGCPSCGNERKALSLSEFKERCSKVHNNKYDYTYLEYKNHYSKIKIICPEHGLFLQKARSHMEGSKCPKCSPYRLKDNDWFIKKANTVHNNRYNYSLAKYTKSVNKVVIICNFHGEFKQEAASHIAGQGCPKCTHIVSKPETAWLDSYGILIKNRNIKLKGLKGKNVDGYDPITNTVYEFHGDYWHGNPNVFNPDDINKNTKTTFKQLYNKTIEKENLIKQAGYNLVTIWEQDYKNLIKLQLATTSHKLTDNNSASSHESQSTISLSI